MNAVVSRSMVAGSDLADRINAEHSLAGECARGMAQHARRVGELLLEARDGCPSRHWLSWLSANCPEIAVRTAQVYMKLARDCLEDPGKAAELDAGSLRQAYIALAPPKPANTQHAAHTAEGGEAKPSDAPKEPAASNSRLRTESGLRSVCLASATHGASDEQRPVETPPDTDGHRETPNEPQGDESGAPDLPTEDEMAEIDAAIEREYQHSIAKVMESTDQLAAAHAQIKLLTERIAGLNVSLGGYMRGKTHVIDLLREERSLTKRLRRVIEQLKADNENLRENLQEKTAERTAIVEESLESSEMALESGLEASYAHDMDQLSVD